MKKILISSQDFGYGATTQLFALLKHLLDEHHQEVNIHILANASSQTFYTNFLKYNPAYDSCLSFIHNPEKEYDTYVGVYDPFVIFEGARKRKKTIFLCNLGFLRSADPDFLHTFNPETFLSSLSPQINHHNNIIAAFLLANVIFMRQVDHFPEGELSLKIKEKITFLGPIIYPKLYAPQINKKPQVIFQLGGQVNPLTSTNFYKQYFMLIKQITQFVKKRDYEIVLIINPLLLHIAKQIFPSQYTLLPTLAQEEYQKMLAISSALFAPLGINTYYESSYYNIPTFILPEQHLGHIKSIQRYFPSLKSIKKQSFCLIHPFPELLKCLEVSEKEYIIYLEEKITQLKESFLEISHISEFLQNGKNLFTKYHYDKQISQHIEKIITHILS